MNVNLTAEQQQIINDELRAGHFRTVEEVIGEALKSLQKVSASTRVPTDEQRAAVSEMRSFVEKNQVRLEGISIKELIEQGRRM
jgi:hypothetical protein